MGAPMPEMEPVENATAEALLCSLKTIAAGERRKHATVFNYWQSIRKDRPFPPIRDLDPMEISDAGPWSILLEMIGGGEDAILRHFGQAIRLGLEVEKVGDAPHPSLLASIHNKLPIVAACRQAFAFEEAFETDEGTTRCWVTLLPFSETGTWIDYVYGFVSLALPGAAEEAPDVAEEATEAVEETVEAADEPVEAVEEAVEPIAEEPVAEEAVADDPAAPEEPLDPLKVPLGRLDDDDAHDEPDEPLELAEAPVEAVAEPEPEPEPEAELAVAPEPELVEPLELPEEPVEAAAELEPEPEYEPESEPTDKPSFSSKLLDSLASFSGFHGRVAQAEPFPDEMEADEPQIAAEEAPIVPEEPEPVADEPELVAEEPEAIAEEPEAIADEPELVADEPELVADEPAIQPTYDVEGTLQNKLTEVRAKAEEARQAQLACDKALHEGLGAAYDFALDAEHAPEEYLRLVEAQGLKIQLRSPMKPVARLAFDGTCDEASFAQLEAVLAWALKQDLPRGSLPERIEAEGGIGQILGQLRAA